MSESRLPFRTRSPALPAILEPTGEASATAFGAVVLVGDRVRFQTATRTREELNAAVAAYIGRQAPFQLWPEEAARVARWLHRGAHEQAIGYYFAVVGRRWDREQLHWVMPEPAMSDAAPLSETARGGEAAVAAR